MKVHLRPELNKFPGRLRRDSGQNTVRHPEPMSPRTGEFVSRDLCTRLHACTGRANIPRHRTAASGHLTGSA